MQIYVITSEIFPLKAPIEHSIPRVIPENIELYIYQLLCYLCLCDAILSIAPTLACQATCDVGPIHDSEIALYIHLLVLPP